MRRLTAAAICPNIGRMNCLNLDRLIAKANIVHDLLPLLEAEAKERQRDAGRLAKKFAKHEANGKASQAAARYIGDTPRPFSIATK